MKTSSLRAPATNSSKESSPVGQQKEHIRSKAKLHQTTIKEILFPFEREHRCDSCFTASFAYCERFQACLRAHLHLQRVCSRLLTEGSAAAEKWINAVHPPSISLKSPSGLTISIYINPVKHAVGEILGRGLVVFVAVYGSDGLWGDRNISALIPGGSSKKSSP